MLLFQIFQKAYFEQKKQYNLFSSLFSLYHTNHFFTVIYIDIKFTSNGKNIKPYLYFFHVRMCTVCEFGCLWPFERLTSDMSAVWWICHINSSFCLCVWVFVTPEDKVFHARLFHYLRSALLLTKWEKCVHACVSVCVSNKLHSAGVKSHGNSGWSKPGAEYSWSGVMGVHSNLPHTGGS